MYARRYTRWSLTAAINRAGHTHQSVANTLGLSKDSVAGWAIQEWPIPAKHVPALVELLGVTEDELAEMSRKVVRTNASAALAQRGITIQQAAAQIGVSKYRLKHAVEGRGPMVKAMREGLEELLGLPGEYLASPAPEPPAEGL